MKDNLWFAHYLLHHLVNDVKNRSGIYKYYIIYQRGAKN